MVRLSSAFCLLMLVPFVFGMLAVPNECEDSGCAPDGPPIRFPFQRKGSNSSNQCGYPGFDLLSCTPDKETVLELPLPADPFPARFYVHDIDYKAQKFLVNNSEEYCLSRQLSKLAHSPSRLFRYYPYNLTFFNCSLSSSPCQIRVVDSGTDVSEQVSCTKMQDVLLPGTSPQQDPPFFSTDIYDSDYFQISWTKPNCTGCQKPGQKCHFIDNEIQCFSTKHKGNIIVNANLPQEEVQALLALAWWVVRSTNIARVILRDIPIAIAIFLCQTRVFFYRLAGKRYINMVGNWKWTDFMVIIGVYKLVVKLQGRSSFMGTPLASQAF